MNWYFSIKITALSAETLRKLVGCNFIGEESPSYLINDRGIQNNGKYTTDWNHFIVKSLMNSFLVSFIWCHINIHGLVDAKAILVEKQQWYYLTNSCRGLRNFIPFPSVLVLCEMQSVSSRIWTRAVVSISYDDNHYTTGTSYATYSWTNQNLLKRK